MGVIERISRQLCVWTSGKRVSQSEPKTNVIAASARALYENGVSKLRKLSFANSGGRQASRAG